MLNSPKVLALREDLNRAAMTLSTSEYDVSDKELRDEVCRVVDDLKAAGWPPERALIAMKEIALEAGLTQTKDVLRRDRELCARDALLAKVVRWTIECYYDVLQTA